MQKEKVLRPKLTIDGRQNSINIGRDVIRILGYPAYVCLLKNDEQASIAVKTCGERETLSFKVPDGFPDENEKKFRVYSRSFIRELIGLYGLDPGKSQSFSGTYIKEQDMVVFCLSVQN